MRHEAMAFDIPVGKQLSAILGDQSIQTVLFERFDDKVIKGQFGDLFALHEANFGQKAQPGETLFMDLWWSATAQPKLDYSVGVYLMDANGQVVAQSDNAPGDTPTSQWVLDKLYFDRHKLVIPANLAAGSYQVAVAMYWFGDQRPLPVNSKPNVIVGQIQVSVPNIERRGGGEHHAAVATSQRSWIKHGLPSAYDLTHSSRAS